MVLSQGAEEQDVVAPIYTPEREEPCSCSSQLAGNNSQAKEAFCPHYGDSHRQQPRALRPHRRCHLLLPHQLQPRFKQVQGERGCLSHARSNS